MTPAEQVADQLAVTDTDPAPTTAAEVVEQAQAGLDPHRAAWFAAMHAALDWLAAHPGVPIPGRFSRTRIAVHTAEGDFALVERVAGLIGADPVVRADGGQMFAAREFGGLVEYEIDAHSAEHMARHAAEMTYAGAVSP